MTTVIKEIQQALEEQDIEKVYESYHRFFDHFDPEKDLQEMADLATYSVSIGFYEEAKRALLRLTEVEPDEAIWTILLAEILVAEGETDQALFYTIFLKRIQTIQVCWWCNQKRTVKKEILI